MVARKSVSPEMGCHYYTRSGVAAYIAYAFENGSPLPTIKGVQNYPRAIGFIVGMVGTHEWFPSGSHRAGLKYADSTLDLVEKITMECAFQYPRRSKRPKPKPAEQMGMLI